jgi:hypothetical protein
VLDRLWFRSRYTSARFGRAARGEGRDKSAVTGFRLPPRKSDGHVHRGHVAREDAGRRLAGVEALARSGSVARWSRRTGMRSTESTTSRLPAGRVFPRAAWGNRTP